MILSSWTAGIIERAVDENRRQQLLDAISSLDESTFGRQDLDRMAAAIIILFLEGLDLELILREARMDWRDLLMDAGLEHHDWPIAVSERFPPASDR